MPILQIKLTAPTGDVTKAIRQIRADESKAFAIGMRQVNQQRLADQKLYNEKLKGLKDVARARDIDAAAMLKQARAQAVANRESEKARRDAERSSRSSRGGGGSGIGSFVAGGVAAVASQQTLSLINQTRAAYTDYVETVNKSSVVFGKNAAEIMAWSKDSATAFGLSERDALDAAGTFGNLFQAFKLGDNNSAVMSKRLVQLAADLASFNNTSVQDAIDALKSGIVGEIEPLRKYGIILNDEVLKAEAKRIGLIKETKGVLDQTIKSQAAYSLILQQTTKAQGDFARTSDEAANKSRIVTAQIENLQVKLGKELAPAYASVLKVAGEFAETLNKVTPEQIELLKQIATPILVIGGGAAGLVLAANGVTAIATAMKALSISGPGGLLILGGLITAASILQRMNSESDAKMEGANTTFAQDLRSKAGERGGQISALRGYQQYRKGNMPRVLDPMSAEHQGLKAAGLTSAATPRQIETAIRKLEADRQKYTKQAARQQQIANKGAGATNVDTAMPPVNLTGSVVAPVIPKGSGGDGGKAARAAEAAAKRAAKDAAASLVEAAERSRNSYAIAFDEALSGGGTSGELYRLSNTLKAQDMNVANAKRSAAGGTKTGKQDYLTNLAKARQEAIERGRKIEQSIADAREDTLKATLKSAREQTEVANKNRENQIEFLKLEHDRLDYAAEDAKVTGNITKRKEALQQLYDNELATLRAQYALDIRQGVPVSVAQARLRTGTTGAGQTFGTGVAGLRSDAFFSPAGFGANGTSRSDMSSVRSSTLSQGQRNGLAVSETLRQVFADAGSSAGPAFFEGLLSGDGGKAQNAFRMFGENAGQGFARKLSGALIDRPIQKAFDDIAGKIADSGKIAGFNLYQGASAIYGAAQALAAAQKGKSGGLIGGILGAVAGAFIPGIGPVAGFGIGSNLFQGNIVGAGLGLLGSDYGSSLARIGGSGINLSNGGESTSKDGGGTTSKSAKVGGRGVSVTYNMYGDVNDRQDAERARRARTDELKNALAMG